MVYFSIFHSYSCSYQTEWTLNPCNRIMKEFLITCSDQQLSGWKDVFTAPYINITHASLSYYSVPKMSRLTKPQNRWTCIINDRAVRKSPVFSSLSSLRFAIQYYFHLIYHPNIHLWPQNCVTSILKWLVTLKELWTSVSSRSMTTHFLCISWCLTVGRRYLHGCKI